LFGKTEFSQVFKERQVIESGARVNRKGAARLIILSINEDRVQYKSLRSHRKQSMKYPYLKALLDDFESINPNSIEKSVNVVLNRAGLDSDYTTETYMYSFAKAFLNRVDQDIFLSEGELSIDELPPVSDRDYIEGARIPIWVERIERDRAARLKCIRHHGAWCHVCEIDFEKVYGRIGRGFIHVHHLKQLSAVRNPKRTDPINDLIPLCPNCHAMIHRKKRMVTIESLRKQMSGLGGPTANLKAL
jgi:predicted HNH restriction endonuclease